MCKERDQEMSVGLIGPRTKYRPFAGGPQRNKSVKLESDSTKVKS